MTLGEYFGGWLNVFDTAEYQKVNKSLTELYRKHKVYPAYDCVFKAFRECKYNNLSVVILGQDPYFDGNATGLAFANNVSNKNMSPSLKVLRKAVCGNAGKDYESSPFDQTLLSWAHHGVLLLNTALTVEAGQPGSHAYLWRPFIKTLLQNLGKYQTGIIYVLMGTTAKTFRPYIGKYNDIIECPHPAYCARTLEPFPNVFERIDELTMSKNGFKIKWI